MGDGQRGPTLERRGPAWRPHRLFPNLPAPHLLLRLFLCYPRIYFSLLFSLDISRCILHIPLRLFHFILSVEKHHTFNSFHWRVFIFLLVLGAPTPFLLLLLLFIEILSLLLILFSLSTATYGRFSHLRLVFVPWQRCLLLATVKIWELSVCTQELNLIFFSCVLQVTIAFTGPKLVFVLLAALN